MSQVPADLQYTETHEWVRKLPDGAVEIGITHHAQDALGELVFVEVAEAGRSLNVAEPMAVVESVKAASDVYCPMAGEVIAGNSALATTPGLVNTDSYGEGWLIRLRPTVNALTPGLLSAAEYEQLLKTEAT